MFDSLGRLYDTIIYIPQLNLLQFFYNITGDIGFSIIFLAIVVNLLMWPLFSGAYINGQKLRVLQPLLTEVREKYKDDPQTMLKEMRTFNEKHGIRNNSLFLVIIVQLVFATARDITGKSKIRWRKIKVTDTKFPIYNIEKNFTSVLRSLTKESKI